MKRKCCQEPITGRNWERVSGEALKEKARTLYFLFLFLFLFLHFTLVQKVTLLYSTLLYSTLL